MEAKGGNQSRLRDGRDADGRRSKTEPVKSAKIVSTISKSSRNNIGACHGLPNTTRESDEDLTSTKMTLGSDVVCPDG